MLAAVLAASPAFADAPVVEDVTISGTVVSVTLSHPDTGWDHYADGWEVLDKDGNSLGLRVLAHPHVNEQPFTRSLSGVEIPAGTKTLFIRTRCNVDGWSQDLYAVKIGAENRAQH